MDYLSEWQNWLSAFTLGGLGLGALVWFFGGAQLLGILKEAVSILRVIFETISPSLRDGLKAGTDGLIWVWQNVFWKGIKDIFEDWVTIVTVATAGFLLWSSAELSHKWEMRQQIAQTNACYAELHKIKRRLPPPAKIDQPQVWTPFDIFKF